MVMFNPMGYYSHSSITNANPPLGYYPQPRIIYLKSTSNLSVTVLFFIAFLNNRRYPCDLNDPGLYLSSKYYKSLLPTIQSPTTTFRPAQRSTSIPLSARTVWYRCIHKKKPTKQRLHQLISTTYHSPFCSVCSLSTIEDNFHFLFACLSKLANW
jgi:hypothetical protein